MRLNIAIFWVVMSAGSWVGQEAAPLPTVKDITTRIGTEVDARNVIGKILSHAMAQSHREYFLASQIRKEWLPAIRNVELVRLADSEIAEHLSRCGTYWIIDRVERADNVVSVRLYNRCGSSTLDYAVSLDGNVWRLGLPGTGKDGGGWGPGIGSGFPGRPAGCPCVGALN